ncbi:MAG: hypothetical protein ABSB91_00100 [Sedimentisphaerales bacterium]|jgi:hypothetical protein
MNLKRVKEKGANVRQLPQGKNELATGEGVETYNILITHITFGISRRTK